MIPRWWTASESKPRVIDAMMRGIGRVATTLGVLTVAACGGRSTGPGVGGTDSAAGTDGGPTESDGDGGETSGAGSGSGPDLPESHATVVHSFGTVTLAPHQELQPCIQWTVGNEKAIYVNRVTLANDGAFHHSNWFVVPESYAEGEDGFFDCSARQFNEVTAALAGTVLTAQSTQSRFETMQLPEGIVVKVPPRHKIVAGGHLLNLSSAQYESELRMELEIIHPNLVQVVTAPLRLSYIDLEILAQSEVRFRGHCNAATLYEGSTGNPFDLKLYYVLPHYHYLGNYFDLSILGGPRDEESIFRLQGFNADANGRSFDPPIDFTGAQGFTFTCGYDNWRNVQVGWGIGDQEMCVMLGLADSALLMDGSVADGDFVDQEDGIPIHQGDCTMLGLPKNEAQSMPTPEEIEGEMYVPESDVEGLPVVDDCADTPADADPQLAPTLSSIRDTLFASSCQFSSCHAGANAVAGLDLRAEDLHAELLGHQMQLTETDLNLVEPGDPEASWLYRAIAKCDPAGDGTEPHMPLNAPELVDPRMVAMVREWIAAGALDN